MRNVAEPAGDISAACPKEEAQPKLLSRASYLFQSGPLGLDFARLLIPSPPSSHLILLSATAHHLPPPCPPCHGTKPCPAFSARSH